LGIPALISQALAMYVTINALDGNGVDEQALARALELEDRDSDVPIAIRAETANARLLTWIGKLDEAQGQCQVLRQCCIERGAESDVMFVAVHSALVDIWRGRYADSARAARDAVERAEQIGGDHLLVIAKTMRGATAAYAGRENDARADAQAAPGHSSAMRFRLIGVLAAVPVGIPRGLSRQPCRRVDGVTTALRSLRSHARNRDHDRVLCFRCGGSHDRAYPLAG
jgi:hypothetical protein